MRIRTRVISTCTVMLLSVAIAAGCSDTSSDDPVTASDGPLAYLPSDTWVIASLSASNEQLNRAVTTLDRLPIWALAEGFLPASDGKGLRKAALTEIAKSAPKEAKLTQQRLERAFGDGGGVAITSNDFSRFEGDSDNLPLAIWLDVDDKDTVDSIMDDFSDGKVKEASHAGESYSSGTIDGEPIAWLHLDETVLITTSIKELERLISTHDNEEGVAKDADALRVIEAGVGDAITGVAVNTKPLLDAVPGLLETEGDVSKADADKLRELLKTNAVGAFVPDWMSASTTIDHVGLRVRGAWSSPNDLAEPETDARDLVERLPAETTYATGQVTSGTELARVQDAWKQVAKVYDVKIDDLVKQCDADERVLCQLIAEAAKVALEDDAFAKAAADAGPQAVAYTQDFAGLFGTAMSSVTGAKGATPTSRVMEFIMPATSTEIDYTPPKALVDAATAAGVTFATSDEGRTVNVKVRANSPLGRELRTALQKPENRTALAVYGIDFADLTKPAGLTISAEKVDDLLVLGFPLSAPSAAAAALADGGDQLGDSDSYKEAVRAAKPPKRVGAYSFVNISPLVIDVLEGFGAVNTSVTRAVPTVKNNLDNVPGMLTWTTRERVDGEDVGVFETVVVITD